MEHQKLIRVHEVCPYSRVNGPGVRAVVWVQGCSLGCRGCFNPETHPASANQNLYNPSLLGSELGQLPVDGLTVSGGEPLEQPEAVAELVRAFRKENKGTALLFTGYTIQSIVKSESKRKAMLQFDAVLAGQYKQDSHEIWKGKQLALVTDRIKANELKPQRKIELVVEKDSVYVTGFPTQRASSIVQHLL